MLHIARYVVIHPVFIDRASIATSTVGYIVIGCYGIDSCDISIVILHCYHTLTIVNDRVAPLDISPLHWWHTSDICSGGRIFYHVLVLLGTFNSPSLFTLILEFMT